MKKWISLVALLLACMLVLSACQSDKKNETDTTKGQQDKIPENTVYGYWYSDKANFVLEVANDTDIAKCYSLSTGFYEYYAIQDATYVYNTANSTLVLTLNDVPYNFIYNADEDTLTLHSTGDSGTEYTTEYVREYEAPAKHPVYSFPKYADMDLTGIMTLPDYASYHLRDIAIAEARMDIFSEYFEMALESPTVITDRAAKFGDLVIIDYVGYMDGVAFSGGSANDAEVSILYNSGYIPGFAEGIIGHSTGDTFDVLVTFPDNYGNGMSGKNAVFTMTIKKIYDVRLTQAQFDTYQNMIYESYEEWVEAVASEMAGELALTMILENTVLVDTLPEETYLYFYQSYVDYAHYMATSYKMTYEKFCSIFGYSDEMFLAQAQNIANNYVICELIVREQNLTWTEDEYKETFDSFVQDLVTNGYTQEDATLYVTNNQIDNVYAELSCKIAVKWLGENTFQ